MFWFDYAPSAFQRLMNKVFEDMVGTIVQIYLDDILVMSKTPEEHIKHLGMVLARLEEKGLRAKLSKCEWAKQELRFLGHIVGNGQVRPDPEKLQIIKDWPVPKDVKQLQSFLGWLITSISMCGTTVQLQHL
jgi:hypothetical protein